MVLSRYTDDGRKRIVTKDLFFGSKKQFDNVIVLANDDGEDEFSVWFAHALCLVRLCKKDCRHSCQHPSI